MREQTISVVATALISTFLIGGSFITTAHKTEKDNNQKQVSTKIKNKVSHTKPDKNVTSESSESSSKPTLDLNGQLQNAWSKTDTSNVTNAQIAIYDRKTNQVYTYSHGATNNYPTASIIKVFILTYKMSLGALNEHDKDLATKMIEKSDNDATTEMTKSFGGIYQFHNLFEQLGMNSSNINNTWGLTQTTADDQLKLLNDLFYDHKVLSENDSNYIIDLMSHIDDKQNWGVSHGVSSDTEVQLKNGWLPLADYYKNAIVNSIGHVQDDNVDYTIAVLSNGDNTQDNGIDYVNNLSQATYNVLSRQ